MDNLIRKFKVDYTRRETKLEHVCNTHVPQPHLPDIGDLGLL